MFDYNKKKQGSQECFAFFFPWSKLRVLQKWEETLKKEKGIEKNEYEQNDKRNGNIRIEKKMKIESVSWNKNIQKNKQRKKVSKMWEQRRKHKLKHLHR